ncbi:xylulokinase [Stella humosa]|uniref:Xylulose kinase n=1 Tax=Stella humosa TaxID=94 RepID=A0A3N1KQ48_9PROT|nr:xylulokinase [Stella humosa]ROP81417.1 xylulokinase [Stella humosa]BBK32769.1 xylulokinase [Stella humosa]
MTGPLWLGIDVGTSSVKVVLVDDADRPVADAASPLRVDRPQPQWAEQDPEDWWLAAGAALDRLAADHPAAMARVAGMGLSGQMLGVAAVDRHDRPLRPAILWNDGRAAREGAMLERVVPGFAAITGSRPMAGFPAPKLLWLNFHEPDVLRRARHVLLPKDYLRWRLSGDAASDRADASATLLMDTAAGTWHPPILAACGITADQLPRLVECAEVTGHLRPELARRWGLPVGLPIVGGAGDNMCGGVGAGVVTDGAAFVSLGTSGVYFVANRDFQSSVGQGMHTHRHGVAGLFCQQAVILSAAAALTWVADLLGADDVGRLVAEVEAAGISSADTPVFTPYLAGERTPHDDPGLLAAFSGLSFATGRLHLVQAVMEGVALALADCQDALAATGAAVTGPIALVGGGARSRLWARLVAAATGRPVSVAADAAVGPALGAARLARAGAGGPLIGGAGELLFAAEPDASLAGALAAKRDRYCAHPRR